jgi:hypothetical protein
VNAGLHPGISITGQSTFSNWTRLEARIDDNALNEVYVQLLMTDPGMSLARSGSLPFSLQLRVLRLSLPKDGKIGVGVLP